MLSERNQVQRYTEFHSCEMSGVSNPHRKCWPRWYSPVSVLWRLRQKNPKFKVHLGYTDRPCLHKKEKKEGKKGEGGLCECGREEGGMV